VNNTALFNSATYHVEYQEREYLRKQDAGSTIGEFKQKDIHSGILILAFFLTGFWRWFNGGQADRVYIDKDSSRSQVSQSQVSIYLNVQVLQASQGIGDRR